MIEDRKLAFDRDGFDRAMEGQREKARAKSAFKEDAARGGVVGRAMRSSSAADRRRRDVFRGYESTSVQTPGARPVRREPPGRSISSRPGTRGFVALAETPFYLEAGGQVSDVGRFAGPHGEAPGHGRRRVPNWPRLHAVHVLDRQR